MNLYFRLQTTQSTRGGAVTAVSQATVCQTAVQMMSPPPVCWGWDPDLPFFVQDGHADRLDGWHCSSCCCSPLGLCSPQSGFPASRKLRSRIGSVGLLHKSDGVSNIEDMLYVMRYTATVGAYDEASIFLNPTPVRAQEFAISISELGDGSTFPPD